jgi:hypothetical protein
MGPVEAGPLALVSGEGVLVLRWNNRLTLGLIVSKKSREVLSGLLVSVSNPDPETPRQARWHAFC